MNDELIERYADVAFDALNRMDGVGEGPKVRLDWEIVNDALDELGENAQTHVDRLMIAQCSWDLGDLLVNGDIKQTDDPLLEVMDGSLVRGQSLKSLSIAKVDSTVDRSDERGTTQYQWFLTIEAEWE